MRNQLGFGFAVGIISVAILAQSVGCTGREKPSPQLSPPARESPSGLASAPPSASATERLNAPGAPSSKTTKGPEAEGNGCGGLGCRLFDSPAQALAEILKSDPQVVGFGESHAQRGSEGIESATSHFTRELLPLLKGGSSDLVLELMLADGTCGAKTEAKVAAKQKPVTEPQRESNQNEFLTLGNALRASGVRPHVLRPSCPDYLRISQAKDDAIGQMLTLIADESANLVRAILARNKKEGATSRVLTYGGALHNDTKPRPGFEAWSYGPRLSQLTKGRYVEVDLIVPEFVRDTETWKALPWYPLFDKAAHPEKTTLFNPAPQSFVLIFPAFSSPGQSPAKLEATGGMGQL